MPKVLGGNSDFPFSTPSAVNRHLSKNISVEPIPKTSDPTRGNSQPMEMTSSGVMQEGDKVKKDGPLKPTVASGKLVQDAGGPLDFLVDKVLSIVGHLVNEDTNPRSHKTQSNPLCHLHKLSPSEHLIERRKWKR